MILVYIIFIWLVVMIAYNLYTSRKEKERMTISKGGMRKYSNGRYKW